MDVASKKLILTHTDRLHNVISIISNMGNSPHTIRRKVTKTDFEVAPEGSLDPNDNSKEVSLALVKVESPTTIAKKPRGALIDDEFMGTGSVSVVIQTKETDHLTKALLMKAHVPLHYPTQDADLFSRDIRKYDHVIYVIEIVRKKPLYHVDKDSKMGMLRTSAILITDGSVSDEIARDMYKFIKNIKVFRYNIAVRI